MSSLEGRSEKMKNEKRNGKDEEVDESALQKVTDTSITEEDNYLIKENLLNFWKSLQLVKENPTLLYSLEAGKTSEDIPLVHRIDIGGWSLIMKPSINNEALFGYGEIIQEINDAIKNKNYVIVYVDGNYASLYEFKEILKSNISDDAIIIDNPTKFPPEEDKFFEEYIGIIKIRNINITHEHLEIVEARKAQ